MPTSANQPPDPDDPRFIRGIYNYCDRWCDRCEFSHRCYSFARNERYFGDDPEARDSSNKKFWDTLGRIFTDIQASLQRAAESDGVSLDAHALAVATAHEKHVERRARARGLRESKSAMSYALMVDEWFNNELRQPLAHVRELGRQVEAGTVRVAEAKGELVRLNDCVEVLRWYQHFIFVKLGRAFSSLVEEEEYGLPTDADSGAQSSSDSNGSAKTALVAIDRSISAWAAMREMFPDKTDCILELLVHLGRLMHGVEKKFPRARAFQRPGFDE